ncbi:Protein of uncharacterised function (DUF1266) [Leminorella richardii]|uniref:Protein of uncharacterized function (DUF1266) n=1 Tax=Leminorella richardii TaxID=158841 RepID=A0A2X4V0G8_9GAMM|nr:DUF1266 domain-containing protein [Leminorella richardii]SQI44119.1 Protein of uncharacterised function (DUF1266) [Leminorella richardii]
MDQLHQHWLFALSAPMAAMNLDYGATYTAPNLYPNSKKVDLTDSWDIDSKSALIDTVTRMVDDGHAENLSSPYYLWHRLTPSRWKEYCLHQEAARRPLLEFIASTAMVCGDGGIRAWDLSRMGFLCRIGVLNGWLTEEESLWFQSRIARRARHYYANWQTYASGFIIGRSYWLSLREEDPTLKPCALNNQGLQASNVNVCNRLLGGEDSPYQRLPWDIDMEQIDMEKPDSLAEVDWQ